MNWDIDAILVARSILSTEKSTKNRMIQAELTLPTFADRLTNGVRSGFPNEWNNTTAFASFEL